MVTGLRQKVNLSWRDINKIAYIKKPGLEPWTQITNKYLRADFTSPYLEKRTNFKGWKVFVHQKINLWLYNRSSSTEIQWGPGERHFNLSLGLAKSSISKMLFPSGFPVHGFWQSLTWISCFWDFSFQHLPTLQLRDYIRLGNWKPCLQERKRSLTVYVQC